LAKSLKLTIELDLLVTKFIRCNEFWIIGAIWNFKEFGVVTWGYFHFGWELEVTFSKKATFGSRKVQVGLFKG